MRVRPERISLPLLSRSGAARTQTLTHRYGARRRFKPACYKASPVLVLFSFDYSRLLLVIGLTSQLILPGKSKEPLIPTLRFACLPVSPNRYQSRVFYVLERLPKREARRGGQQQRRPGARACPAQLDAGHSRRTEYARVGLEAGGPRPVLWGVGGA